MIGTTLLHYRVTAALGVGGMGEVWRAEDEKLGREVALKVLPEEFAQDPERMARFEREAKVLASLNHPNIAHLYGLESVDTQMAAGTAAPSGSANGFAGTSKAEPVRAEPEGRSPMAHASRVQAADSESPSNAEASPTTFLVMELVEGEDLSERIKRGPIPIEEATTIALQIAEALEAAHESGIVHRDLKPANIKLRPDGTVKVLDFGLAKAWETDHGDSSISMSPTLTQHATAAGIILGTAAYMSPEQAAGIAADRRADIWAFGVVFWEMLTGKKLFEGETVSHVLAAVLKDDIDLDALPGDTPARLKELIGRCLKKKPKQRLQAIGDARVVLEEYAADPESFEALAAADGVPAAVIPLWRRLLPWAATAVLALALAAVVFLRPSPHDLAVRFQIVAPDNLTEVGPPTISPDGRTIAFEATDEKGATLIWVRSMDDLQARPLAGTEGATRPFWSPDSRYLAFIAGGKLKKVPLAGGPPQTLAETPSGSDGTWSSRGEILFDGRSGDPIRRVAASGGTPQDLITADPEDGIISVGWPQFLPDGRRFLYVANGAETDERFLMVGDIEDKEPPRKLLDVSSLVRFAPPDHLLYVREDSLLAQPFDPDSAELQGEAVPLAEELGATSTGLSDFSASNDGTLVYRSGWTSERRLVWTDRNGRELGDADQPAVYRETAISPDGMRLAMTVEDSQSDNRDIWVRDLERGVTSRFTFDPGRDSTPVWSPDGKRIVFSSNRDGGSYGLFVKDATGGGQAEAVPNSGPSGALCDWSRDGRWLAFHANQEDTGWDVWVLAMDGEDAGTATPFVQGRFTEVLPRFSPDGRWIAYMSNESGRMEVYVQPFPGPGGKWQISTDGGREPQWSDDGREIRYLSPGGALMSVPVTPGPSFSAGTPRELFDVRLQPIIVRNRWLATPDGERFLLLQPQGSNRSLPMTVVLDWAEALPER